MQVCEIFSSIQGESTYAGLPCTFVRLAGCNLRCVYCDTHYAYENGMHMSVDDIVREVRRMGIDIVAITGGEPLLQIEEVNKLTRQLFEENCMTLIDTNGSISIRKVDKRAVIIFDIKTPGSGMNDKMDLSQIVFLKPSDEVKFVICNRADYEWARDLLAVHKLLKKCVVLFSPAYHLLEAKILARWIIEDRLNVRLNLQLHKYIGIR